MLNIFDRLFFDLEYEAEIYTVFPDRYPDSFRAIRSDGTPLDDPKILGELFLHVSALDLADRLLSDEMVETSITGIVELVDALSDLYATDALTSVATSFVGAGIVAYLSGGTIPTAGIYSSIATNFVSSVSNFSGSTASSMLLLQSAIEDAFASRSVLQNVQLALNSGQVILTQDVPTAIDLARTLHKKISVSSQILAEDELLNRTSVGDAVEFGRDLIGSLLSVIDRGSVFGPLDPIGLNLVSVAQKTSFVEDILTVLLSPAIAVNDIESQLDASFQSFDIQPYFSPDRLNEVWSSFGCRTGTTTNDRIAWKENDKEINALGGFDTYETELNWNEFVLENVISTRDFTISANESSINLKNFEAIQFLDRSFTSISSYFDAYDELKNPTPPTLVDNTPSSSTQPYVPPPPDPPQPDDPSRQFAKAPDSGSTDYLIVTTRKDVNLPEGQSIAVSDLFPESGWVNLLVGTNITHFVVGDRNSGGGWLTYDGDRVPDQDYFEMPISELDKWEFVAGPNDSRDEIAFNIINTHGYFSKQMSDGADIRSTAPELAQLEFDDVEVGGERLSWGDTAAQEFEPGDTLTINFDVRNVGDADAPSSDAAAFFYYNNDFQKMDTESISSLRDGRTDTNEKLSFRIPTNLDDGTYFVALISDVENEIREEDEGSQDKGFGFILKVVTPEPEPELPDLEFDAFYLDSTTWRTGDEIDFDWRVENDGNRSSSSVETHVFLSRNSTISKNDDIRIAVDSSSGSFGVGQTRGDGEDFDFDAGALGLTSGTYYVGAIVDPDNEVEESREGNNKSNVVAVQIIANSAPERPTLSSMDVDENSLPGTLVGNISSIDPDGDNVIFRLLDDAGGLFQIDGSRLEVLGALDFETSASHLIRIRAEDSEGLNKDRNFLINVGDVEDTDGGMGPTNLLVSSLEVAEDASVNTLVGTVSAIDPEGDPLTFGLIDNAGGLFWLDGDQLRVNGSLDFETAQAHSIEIEATDAEGLTIGRSFDVNVQDVAEQPVGSGPANLTVSNLSVEEDSTVGASLGTVSATDPDGGPLQFTLLNDAGGLFRLNGNELILNGALDYEQQNTLTIRLQVEDNEGITLEQNFNVSVLDVLDIAANQAPVSLSLSNQTIAENSDAGTTVGVVSATDPDGNSILFSLDDDAFGRFRLVGDRLEVNGPLDFEAYETHEVQVSATDPSGLSTSQVLTISVQDVVEDPSADERSTYSGPQNLTISSFSVDADSTNGTVVGTLSATDPDGDALTYTLIDDADGQFVLSGLNIRVQNRSELGSAVSHLIRVRVEDSSGLSTERSFAISVLGDQEDLSNFAPTGLSLSNLVVSEAASVGTTVGIVSASDLEGDTITFHLASPSQYFWLDGTRLKVSDALDFETSPSHDIVLQARDALGQTTIETFTIQVEDAPEGSQNQAPQQIQISNLSISEDAAIGTVVGSISAIDPDGDALSFSLFGSDSFRLENAQLLVNKVLDFESTQEFDVRLRATDEFGTSTTTAFTINILDVDETIRDGGKTVIEFSGGTVEENSNDGTLVGTFSSEDPDGEAALKLIGSAQFRFRLDGDQLVVNGDHWVDRSRLNYEDNPSHPILIEATDPLGFKTTKSFYVSLTDVDDRPYVDLSALRPQLDAFEGENYSQRVKVIDEDGDEFSVSTNIWYEFPYEGETPNWWTKIENTSGFRDEGNVQYFTISGTPDQSHIWEYVGENNLQIIVEPDVMGQGSLSSIIELPVIIFDSNDPPEVVDDFAIAAEDGFVAIDLLSNDGDHDGSEDPVAPRQFGIHNYPNDSWYFSPELTFERYTRPSFGSVEIDPDGVATYTPAPDFFGTDTFSYLISDGHGASDWGTATIEVFPQNDLPVGSVTISGDLVEGSTLTVDWDFSDADGIGALEFAWLRNGQAISSAISDHYLLTDDDVGSQISFQISYVDEGGAHETLTSPETGSIADSNNAPQASTESLATNEDVPLSIDLLATAQDVDGDVLWVGQVRYDPQDGSLQVDDNGLATFTPAANFHGYFKFDYEVLDPSDASDWGDATIHVSPVNDPVVGSVSILGEAKEGKTLIGDWEIEDIDGVGSLEFTWLKDGNPVVSATTDQLLLAAGDVGAQIQLQISYFDRDGTREKLLSELTSAVTDINIAPLVEDDFVLVSEDGSLQFDVFENDFDENGDPLSVVGFTSTIHGSIEVSESGIATYVPDPDFFGFDSFSYQVSDPRGGRSQGFATVQVAPVNDAPEGVAAISGVMREGETLIVDTSDLEDIDGLGEFSIVWLRNGSEIPEAEQEAYQVRPEDVGSMIGVRVTYTDGGGTIEAVQSVGSSAVLGAGILVQGTPLSDLLEGDLGADTIEALASDDTITGSAGNDQIDGGEGADTVLYSGNQASYTLTLSPTGTMVTDRRPDGNGTDTLVDMEFLDFDTDILGGPFNLGVFGGPAGLDPIELESFIELYIAYFNRSPDAIGLYFWGTAYANGLTLEEIAALFAPQEETLATYPPGTSNEDFASSVYQNVLGRDPDVLGLNFWVGQLDAGNFSRDQFILEVLRGVESGSPDREYLDNKVVVGAYFAVHKGMSDLDNASAVMALFDGTEGSITDAVNAIDGFFTDALDPTGGEFLMPLVGVLDDPFAMV